MEIGLLCQGIVHRVSCSTRDPDQPPLSCIHSHLLNSISHLPIVFMSTPINIIETAMPQCANNHRSTSSPSIDIPHVNPCDDVENNALNTVDKGRSLCLEETCFLKEEDDVVDDFTLVSAGSLFIDVL